MRSRLVVAAILALAGAAAGAAQIDRNLRNRAMQPYRAGLVHMRAEDWPRAIAAFRESIEVDPTFEMAYYTLGRSHLAQKEYIQAATALARCRDLYTAQAGQRFSNAQEAQRYRRERILEIDEIIRQYQLGPQTARTQDVVRQLNERKRQMQETINRGTNIIIENTVPAYVLLALGSAYFRMGRVADAEREYKATIAVDPKTGEAHNNLAVVYFESGRYQEADSALRAAEKAGFRVNPELKAQITARIKSGS